MTGDDPQYLRYKRSHFSTRLPLLRRYTAGHLWLWEQPGGLWRVGFTKFALRMLGDPVELEFEAKPGEAVDKGQVVGWVEGFKAVTDVFSPLSGEFVGANPALDADIELLSSALYDEGWLFAIRGEPDAETVDAPGYEAILDATIDKMLGEEGQKGD